MKKRWMKDVNRKSNAPVYYQQKSSKWVCPKCVMPINGHTPTPDNPEAVPGPGALTICSYCESFLEYTQHGVHLLSDEEFKALGEENQQLLFRGVQYIRELKAKKAIPYPKGKGN